MSAIPQHVLARQKSAIQTLVAAQTAVFGGFEKLIDLNLKVVKATLDEVAQKSQQAVDLKDAQDAASFGTGLVQPSAEKALAYGKHVYDILNGVQVDLAKLAEEQIAEGQQQMQEAVEQFSKNAPSGSESAVALMKSSLATANSAYDSLTKAAKQAAEVAESNLNAAANATFKAASDAADVATKAAGRTRRSA
ncbi:TIGR01841 family phasin [Bordetella holmesii]|uniref:Phasin protein n=2 Tax=Bordetella holmesii TaxID=35814 RepID=A0A158MB84_9BORD|nr:TIGR01841 family phasin [Bordetella holmesii]AHV91732.1 phasin family domain protein [Bordetella holmesii ATCC 51541]AIT24966.1 phasin family domain protein [Bordetella holmesii 44057]EWM45528.1 phasin family domain protein [Bordetella holmesii 70147]EWM48389.1 phasin family domain protein [Bordetella holmesii 41130]EWM49654.1 phasin family domain protein [Bordetella holmesii 35009]